MKVATRRTPAAEPEQQTVELIAAALESFLADHPHAVVLEDGKVIFDMREAKYKLATEHSRCTLHLWGEDRNLVRRVSATTMRNGALRPDETSDAGARCRPRQAHAFDAPGHTSEVSACSGAGTRQEFF